jgi:hypothetical protein
MQIQYGRTQFYFLLYDVTCIILYVDDVVKISEHI